MELNKANTNVTKELKDKEVNLTDDDKRPVIKEGSDDSTGASQDSEMESIGGAFTKEKTVQHKEFLFSGSSSFVKYWNNLIIVLALYNSIFIPLQIFYKNNGWTVLNGEVVTIIDACVDLIFLLDIIIKFRTTFLDAK